MPSFGASQSVSGPWGMNSGPNCKMAMLVAGVARFKARGVGNGTGPNLFTNPTFNSQRDKFRQFWIISGVTKDSAGVALGSCEVHLFDTGTDAEVAQMTSDASGNYSFSVRGNSSTSYAVAYKAGSPDVAGTTVNTLLPTLT